MNAKTWIPLVLALVLALIAAVVAQRVLGERESGVAELDTGLRMVVTTRALPAGSELTGADLISVPVTPQAKPEQGFVEVGEVIGRVTAYELTKGQAIVEPLLTQRGMGSGLQALIPQGMRAITIEVNEFSGLAGMVRPGSRVDLVATLQEGGTDRAMAKTIVHNVLVTAVGQRMTDVPTDPRMPVEPFRSVTILVTPEQAEAVELMSTTARPRLVLRNNMDKETVESAGVSFADLRGRGLTGRDPFATAPIQLLEPTPEQTPAPRVRGGESGRRTVTIIRGTTESTVTFDVPVQSDRRLLTGVERD